MNKLGDVLRNALADIEEKRKRAGESLESGFDLYIENKLGCGDESGCGGCMGEHDGLCPAREALKDVFYAGASCLMIGIEEAGKTGIKGAITEKVEKFHDELNAHGKKMMVHKLHRAFFDLFHPDDKEPVH